MTPPAVFLNCHLPAHVDLLLFNIVRPYESHFTIYDQPLGLEILPNVNIYPLLLGSNPSRLPLNVRLNTPWVLLIAQDDDDDWYRHRRVSRDSRPKGGLFSLYAHLPLLPPPRGPWWDLICKPKAHFPASIPVQSGRACVDFVRGCAREPMFRLTARWNCIPPAWRGCGRQYMRRKVV